MFYAGELKEGKITFVFLFLFFAALQDQSVESLGSIGGTGRYVTAHPPRSTRRELLDADIDDPDARGNSSKTKSKSFMRRLRISPK